MHRRQGGRLLGRLWNAFETPLEECSQCRVSQIARLHAPSSTTSPAFVFDIDGVLVRGKTVLEPAKRALARLYAGDGQEPIYPVCFLTNGGGVLESVKAQQLSKWLGVNVSAEQVVLSHTPFKQLVPRLKHHPVLVAGRHNLKEVAQSYGFEHTVTTTELASAYPHAVPFASATEQDPSAGSLAKRSSTEYGTEASPIKAILVFSDPSNWYIDLQLMTEVITSGGVMGRRHRSADAAPVEIYFSNPDKVFANEHPSPRFGQGALAVALQALLTQVADHKAVRWKVFGKPNPEPYQLAAAVLQDQAQRLGLPQGDGFSAIYMVGDNPESDIAGARQAGAPWTSVLVRTGVFQGGSNSTVHPADLVVEDVEAAVEAALHRARSTKWHSLR